MEDIEYHLSIHGILDPKDEDKALKSQDELVIMYINQWKVLGKGISFSAYMLWKRIHTSFIPIWTNDILIDIIRQSGGNILPISYDTLSHHELIRYLYICTRNRNKWDPLLLLCKNIVTPPCRDILKSYTGMYPYGKNIDECIAIQDKLLDELHKASLLD